MLEHNLHPERNKESENGDLKPGQRIIVMGASTGGFEAIKKIVKGLPPDFDTPILIVWHMSPDIHGVMPQVLNKMNKIYAAHANDNEPIRRNRIYVARPDHHLLIRDS